MYQILYGALSARGLDMVGNFARNNKYVRAVVSLVTMTPSVKSWSTASIVTAIMLHPPDHALSGSWSKGCSKYELKGAFCLLKLVSLPLQKVRQRCRFLYQRLCYWPKCTLFVQFLVEIRRSRSTWLGLTQPNTRLKLNITLELRNQQTLLISAVPMQLNSLHRTILYWHVKLAFVLVII